MSFESEIQKRTESTDWDQFISGKVVSKKRSVRNFRLKVGLSLLVCTVLAFSAGRFEQETMVNLDELINEQVYVTYSDVMTSQGLDSELTDEFNDESSFTDIP